MKDRLTQTLWHLYHRPERPSAPNSNRDLPWHDSAFSERMLREHLDEQHGAASRVSAERAAQVEWLWNQLGLQTNHHLFDITCGPGLYAIPFAQRGCQVTGIDISPAAIAYAQDLARSERLSARCSFIEQDIRQMRVPPASFDGAILLYGQLSILSTDEAQTLLTQIAQTLKSGAKLCIELLNPDKIDKTESSWWFTDQQGLWADEPFLHLGERFWDAERAMSAERYHIIHLESGEMTEISLYDQSYAPQQMSEMLQTAGFRTVQIYPAWDGLPLYDAEEWLVYLAER